jgi:ribosome-associated translation inhibitor RaiA
MTAEVEAIRISGIERDAALRARTAKLMTATLATLSVSPVRSQVTFVDDNGPKGGPAMRCALTVRLPYRPSIRVERSAETPRLAFDAAFAVLERQLERYRERDRDNKRHPKKYFAARAGSTGETSRPAKRARRA